MDLNYETWEHFECMNLFRSQESQAMSSEWLTVSQNPEYEAYLLAEYNRQFNA